MPGSNASSDGFDRSPLHAEAGGEAEAEPEVPQREDGPAEEAPTITQSDDAPVEGQNVEAAGGEASTEKKEPNLGPIPQPSGSTTAGKIFCGGLTVDTVEQDLKAHFEVESLCVSWGRGLPSVSICSARARKDRAHAQGVVPACILALSRLLTWVLSFASPWADASPNSTLPLPIFLSRRFIACWRPPSRFCPLVGDRAGCRRSPPSRPRPDVRRADGCGRHA